MEPKIILISGSRIGIGRYLAEYYLEKGQVVIGCSRSKSELTHKNYHHFILDVSDETKVKKMFSFIRKEKGGLDILVNNAGTASINHSLLTPVSTVKKLFDTNFLGTFLLSREAAKIMRKKKNGRIINFSSLAVPLRIEGESIYASTKAAVIHLTESMSKELAPFGITVNNIGLTPVYTRLLRTLPKEKIEDTIKLQTIKRMGEFSDISNVIDFFSHEASDFITGQTIYLGGIIK